jgi:hypothetical protein
MGSADNIKVDNRIDGAAVFAVKTAVDQENGMDDTMRNRILF